MPKLGRRSERTDLDYQMVPDLVNKDAPFGTNDTSTITMKLVGGNYCPIIEKHPKYKNEYSGSRIQSLRPIADKPNHVDPRIHGDNAGGYYNKDAQLDILSPRPTNSVNKRPDSKDVVRGQFKALPPIQLNRHRNDLSTVFESEPWTGNKNPSLANDTEYKQNYFQGRDSDTGMDTSQPLSNGAKDFHFVSESEHKNLSMLLPSNVLLPVDSIKLTREQETTLCKKICNELNRFDPSELRAIYIECSQTDKELRGFCAMDILDNNLRRHKAFLSDTLRLVAGQFVDPNYPGKVNYEKTLSFIGSALQLNEKGQLSQDKQPKYYMQNGETMQTGSIYRDREVAKLLRMVEQELTMNNYTMNWTRWHNCFCERDRDHRETMSAAQIKDICYDQKLPLSDSLINQVLNLCDSNNRDGQYRWLPFIEFLNRVCPSNTGLPIPRKGTQSPRRESPRRGGNPPEDRAYQPSWQQQYPMGSNSPPPPRRINERDNQRREGRYTDRDNYQHRHENDSGRDNYQQHNGSYTDRGSYQQRDGRDFYRGGHGDGAGDTSHRGGNREQQINQLSQQLQNLETKYEVTKDGISCNDKPWFDRYLKMAKALYKSDISNKGSLPRKDVIDIVNQYNVAFNLDLDMTRVKMLIISPENYDKSGNIVLWRFLTTLSTDRITYKA